jgi:tRNA(Leu) C34 or U34 (ribose-2'-O)-methylase TrmL
LAAHDPQIRHQVGRIGAEISWANTTDRSAPTKPARDALNQRFLNEAGGDPVRAEHLRKAHFLKLALKSAQARKKIKTLTAEAEAAEAELAANGGDAA